MKKIVLLLSALATGCTHSIHMSHMSDVSAATPAAADITQHIVEVSREQTVILGFVFDIDYVDQAYQDLQQKCPKEVVAVNTQFSTSHGFLHWTNKIRMKAVCSS